MREPEAAGIATLWEPRPIGHGVWEQIAVINHDTFWPRWRAQKHEMGGAGWRVDREWVVRLFTNEEQVDYFANTGKACWFRTEGLRQARPAEPMSDADHARQDKEWPAHVRKQAEQNPPPDFPMEHNLRPPQVPPK